MSFALFCDEFSPFSSETVSTSTIQTIDKKICTVATAVRHDPVTLAFNAFDATLDFALPDWEPQAAQAPRDEANTNASNTNANLNGNGKKTAPAAAAAVADRPVQSVPAVDRAIVRAARLQRRLLQRLHAIITYLSSTKIATNYAANIPSRAQTTDKLHKLLQSALTTATELKRSVSSQNQAVLDHVATQLTALKAEVASGTLSLTLIRKVSIAALNAHELLLAAKAALAENGTIRRIADNATVQRATKSLDDNKWVARAQALAQAADEALVAALKEAAAEQRSVQQQQHQQQQHQQPQTPQKAQEPGSEPEISALLSSTEVVSGNTTLESDDDGNGRE